MSQRKNLALLALLALALGLIAASAGAALAARGLRAAEYRALDAVAGEVAAAMPEAEGALLDALRGQSAGGEAANSSFLAAHGYREADFARPLRALLPACAAGLCVGAALFALADLRWRRAQQRRVRELSAYLEAVELGGGALLDDREDGFSPLRDEIYKTVAALRKSREDALAARRGFARNLDNIAHQLKTPLTSMSLALQGLRARFAPEEITELERQLSRLVRLEEALLLLARVDAGALPLEPREVEAFTLLTLSAENLDELLRARGIRADIPELGEASLRVDPEWTMEAVMNLMKNCAEHAPEGSALHCRYAANPLYVEIEIWDEGPGFAPRDLPHLFERFYRGQGAASGGVGIGLSLAREIVELQRGTLRASNRPGAGACFTIHFYRH